MRREAEDCAMQFFQGYLYALRLRPQTDGLHRTVLDDLPFDNRQIPYLARLSDEAKAQLAVAGFALIGHIIDNYFCPALPFDSASSHRAPFVRRLAFGLQRARTSGLACSNRRWTAAYWSCDRSCSAVLAIPQPYLATP